MMPPNKEQWERLRDLLDLADKLYGLHNDVEKLNVYRTHIASSAVGQDICEGWLHGDIFCHLHIKLEVRRPHLHTHDLCISYQRLPHTGSGVICDDFAPSVAKDRRSVNYEVVGERGCLDYELMFVAIGENPELGEGVNVLMTKVEPAAVRLMLLDDCHVSRSDVLQGGAFLEHLGRVRKGELNLPDLSVCPRNFTVGGNEDQLPE